MVSRLSNLALTNLNLVDFQEKVLKQESEYHEKELLKLQKEQELNEVRRQHEKEIYALKKKLHEASIAANNANK